MYSLYFKILIAILFVCLVSGQAPKHYTITTVIAPPFIVENEHARDENGNLIPGEKEYTGFLIDLLDELRNELRFQYTIRKVRDGKYGYKVNGQWRGMIGELVNGRAHMALAPLTITSERAQDVLFVSFMNSGIVPVVLKPGKGEKVPFTSVGSMVRDDREDRVEYGAVSDGSTYQFFSTNGYELYQAMGRYMDENEVMVNNYEEGIERVKMGDYVLFGERPMLSYLAGKSPCNLMIVGNPLNSASYGIAFRRDAADTREEFHRAILKLKESGKYYEIKNKWWEDDCSPTKLCVCEKDVSSEEQSDEVLAKLSGSPAILQNRLVLMMAMVVLIIVRFSN